MNSLTDFLTEAAKKFGTSEDGVKTATGAALGFLQKKADPADFSQLLSVVPGAEGLIPQSSGGGGFLSQAAGMFGGDTASLMALATQMTSGGLKMDQLGGFGMMLFSFLKSSAGEELVGRILAKVPELAKMMK